MILALNGFINHSIFKCAQIHLIMLTLVADITGSVRSIGGKVDYDGALGWYRKGVELFKQAHDESHLSMADFFMNTAIVCQSQKKYSEALDNYNKSLAIYEKNLPSDHPDIGLCHLNIGSTYWHLNNHNLALEHYNRSLQIQLKSLPADHPDIAANYENIVLIYEVKGDLKQAFTYLQKAPPASTIKHYQLNIRTL